MPMNIKEVQTKANKQAIGKTVRETIEILLYGSVRASKPLNYSCILQKVKEDHPNAQTTGRSIDYYAWKLRKQGCKISVARSK